MQKGTTNGFRFSESLIGQTEPAIAVVQLRGGSSYAVKPKAGRRTAKHYGAIGFWKVKR